MITREKNKEDDLDVCAISATYSTRGVHHLRELREKEEEKEKE